MVQNLTYNGWNLIEERDGTGALQQVYVHGAKVDELLTKISSTGAVYYHADGSGSTVALTDETGSVVESYTYDAFGAATIWNASGAAIPSSGYQNRFLFTGREWLADAGIYDYRSRVYSPALGRFLQTDPIRFSAGDRNIYRYCGNNPVSRRDPRGKCGESAEDIERDWEALKEIGDILGHDLSEAAGIAGAFLEDGAAATSLSAAGWAADTLGGDLAGMAGDIAGGLLAAEGLAAAASGIGAGVAAWSIGSDIGTGIANSPVVGGGTVADWWGNSLYNAAPSLWDRMAN